jgi:Ca-activated chloride channel homolog
LEGKRYDEDDDDMGTFPPFHCQRGLSDSVKPKSREGNKMKALDSKKTCLILLVIPLLLAWCVQTSAGTDSPAQSEDKTLSPYFFVQSEDPNIDQLPLKSTAAVVNVSGVIAEVTVTQAYRNEGKRTLEAIYVFPASTRAAVYGMNMTIGERTITARIEKREEALLAYQKAKEEGKTASLLEQHRPNVFQMNVANILPGDEIKTELRYTEILVPTDGIYEFVYPTVVGPRYSNQPASTAPPSEKWSQNPYLHEGEAPRNTFDIKLHVASGVPIDEMSSSSHKVKMHYRDKTSADIELDSSEKLAGNRDFILRYRLAGNTIQSGLLLYQGAKENFFCLMMQPPKQPTIEVIPPREYIFIIDVSGSMYGFPLEISKKLLENLVSGLRPSDTFNVLLFSGGSELFSERSVPAEPGNIHRALQLIQRQQGGGGTELLPAMERAIRLPRTEGVSRSIVIATDGYVTVEPEIFDLIRRELGDANFFAFGIGTSVNRHILEGMARVGAGEPFIIASQDEAASKAEKFRKYVQNPVLTGVRVDFGQFEVYDVEPTRVPDIFAERPAIVFGKWKGRPQGTVALSGTSGKQIYSATLDVSAIASRDESSALQYLWARTRIGQLADYNNLARNDERVGEITELALNYNLLTAYTSFVAIDSEVRAQGGDSTTVKQPLPLPEGVSDLALGGAGQPFLAQLMPAAPAYEASYNSYGTGGLKAKTGPHGNRHESYELALGESDSLSPGASHPSLTVTIGAMTVKGRLSESLIREVVEEHKDELVQCLESVGKMTRGKIFISWTIDADGTVKDIRISPNTGRHDLVSCLTAQIGRWRFQAPEDGKRALVTVHVNVTR